jgi:penicillin-binding protein 1A
MKWEKKFIRWMWVLMFPLPLCLLFFLVYSRMDEVPSFKELENPPEKQASIIYDFKGSEIGRIYENENRKSVTYDQLTPALSSALISTEDERYYTHSGIDIWSLLRAITYQLIGKNAGGASTITQQLAKMIYSPKTNGFWERVKVKITENITAVKLESRYSKNEIIAMYFNRFDFVEGADGIETAAQVYFSKTALELNQQEAATLVGMFQNPIRHNPKSQIKQSKSRRNSVLNKWCRNSKEGTRLELTISQNECDSLKDLELELNYSSLNSSKRMAPYYTQAVKKDVNAILSSKKENGDYLYADNNGNPYESKADGLKIYTSLDLNYQKQAEKAVDKWLVQKLQKEFDKSLKRLKNPPFDNKTSRESADKILWKAAKQTDRYKSCIEAGKSEDDIKKEFNKVISLSVYTYENGFVEKKMSPMDSIRYYKSFLKVGLVSVEPKTGLIKAYVGGPNMNVSNFDHCKSKRQIGSTAKPFLYASAMNMGVISPWDSFANIEYCVLMPSGQKSFCMPATGNNEVRPEISVSHALAMSSNNITLAILKKYGVNSGLNAMKVLLSDLGIDSSKVGSSPSSIYGTFSESVLKMAGAYGALANYGTYVKPRSVLRIEDRNGNLIWEDKMELRKVMQKEEAFRIISIMKKALDFEKGTGRPLKNQSVSYGKLPLTAAITGKTGTTNNASDGWFIGSTPELVTATWVGADDMNVHFPNLKYGQGAKMALPIFGYYMQGLFKNKHIHLSKEDWVNPEKSGLDPLVEP